MKYIEQFGIIIAFTLLGELIKIIVPLSIPAGVYGMVLLLLALITGIIKLSCVKETGHFLIEIMPIMFIPAAVGIMTSVSALREIMLAVLLASILVTIIIMVVTGHATQIFLRLQEYGKLAHGKLHKTQSLEQRTKQKDKTNE
jgi:holin-like protein